MKTTRLLQLGAALAVLPMGAACAAEDTPAQKAAQAVPVAQLSDKEAKNALHDAIWKHDAPRLAELLQARRFTVEELSSHLGDVGSYLYTENSPASPECVRLLLEAGADPHYTGYDGKTPLMEVADGLSWKPSDANALECVRLLLAAGADVNAQDKHGRSPLLYVAGTYWSSKVDPHICTECIRMLLEAGADANVRSDLGYTALLGISSTAHCQEAVRMLLEHGADASVPLPDGRTALHMAAKYGAPEVIRMLTQTGLKLDATDPAVILTAAEGGNTEWVAWLVEHGADVNAKGPHNETPIIRAASKKNVACVRWLMEHGADIHAMTTKGETTLTKLLYWNDDAVVELAGDLLKLGSDPNATVDGLAPIALIQASEYSDARMVRLLLEHGADANAHGDDGALAVDLALAAAVGDKLCEKTGIIRLLLAAGANANSKTTEENESPLHIAAETGHARSIRQMLAAGAKPDERDGYGQTPLMLAARDCNPEAVRALLEAGADIRLRDYSHRTALLHAARGGHSGTVKILLEAGAEVNDTDPRGRTPLMLAAENEYTRVVDVLLEHGADVNAQDAEGRTALMYGRYDEAIVKRLREAGADASIRDFYGESVEDEEKGDEEE